MADVTLSGAVRSNLLSLQGTTDLISRTQGRLSTGLKVASPVDDPVAYFQGKSLNDRANDFNTKKDGIDQGVSTLTTALNAVDGIETLVKQLKGLALSAKSAATSSEMDNVVSQFNDLRTQLNNLATDATYQGLNLVAGTGSTLRVDFSNLTASSLSVESEDLRAGNLGLDIASVANLSAATGVVFSYGSISAGTTLTTASTIVVTVANSSDVTLNINENTAAITFSLGTYSVEVTVGTDDATIETGTALSGVVLSAGELVTFTLQNTSGTTAGVVKFDGISASSASEKLTDGIDAKTYIGVGTTDTINDMITDLESDLTNLRSKAQKLGTNVALLQTRLDFTETYVNTLTTGASKLTLADLNEEGANLLALQTRQQLGIQALSFAGQSEQGILGLFR